MCRNRKNVLSEKVSRLKFKNQKVGPLAPRQVLLGVRRLVKELAISVIYYSQNTYKVTIE
jgi:hypothetical protein